MERGWLCHQLAVCSHDRAQNKSFLWRKLPPMKIRFAPFSSALEQTTWAQIQYPTDINVSLPSAGRFAFITPTQFLTSQETTLIIMVWQVTFSWTDRERSFFLLDAGRKTGSVLFLISGLAATVSERWAWLSVIAGPFYTAATSANCLASLSQEIVIHKESEQKRSSRQLAAALACLRYRLSLLPPESWDCKHYLREKS